MRRLPKILFSTGAAIIVVVALLVSGLRGMLPKLDDYRPQLLAKVQSMTGIALQASFIKGRWEAFGPTLELRDLQAQSLTAQWQAERITLALDVWKSLLHWRWQFRDMAFDQLRLDLNETIDGRANDGTIFEANRVKDIVLRQLEHFELRNSHISFFTPSGSQAELNIPQLTWLNSASRHRAEGQISLSTINGQHGVVQVKIDLHDNQGTLNQGTIYLQADDIDIKPWISQWLQNNTGLNSAQFSLASWLTIKNGEISRANLLLKHGQAAWTIGDTPHRLAVDNLVLTGQRENNGLRVDAPLQNLQTDGQAWPQGNLSALWLPENGRFISVDQPAELRLRASELQLERLTPLLPLISHFTPNLSTSWAALQPQGRIEILAFDIPLQQPELTRFQANWRDIAWQPWKLLPGIEHLAGNLRGSVNRGRLSLNLHHSDLPYGEMFRAPLVINQASGSIDWSNDAQGWELWSDQLDVQAKSLWVNGGFRYQQPVKGEPWLNILAGIRLYDGADAWRYFPEPLMGKHLVDYLTDAIQGGQVENASLVYNGNPRHFPYKNNDGQFQVYVPLRNATFQFLQDWPTLKNLAIDLDFLNDGLWMKAPKTSLGSNIIASIPDYLAERLIISADLAGEGQDIHDYFQQTPLKDSVGIALNELQVSGKVSGRLHLDIPLDEGKTPHATGEVYLNNNSVFINPLESQLKNVSGKFRFNDGNLTSEVLSANWLGQPLKVNFTTKDNEKNYWVNVDLKGDWLANKLPNLNGHLADKLAGHVGWQGKVGVQLPKKGMPNYNLDIHADLNKVSSHLPAPFNKKSGQPLPLNIQAKGDMNGFTLSSAAAGNNQFNSQWLVNEHQITLTRAIWQSDNKTSLPLPTDKELVLNLPALDGESWLALLSPEFSGVSAAKIKPRTPNIVFPERITLQTPQLLLGGQRWNKVTLLAEPQSNGMQISAQAKEINGRLQLAHDGPWQADIDYLYYNPQWPEQDEIKRLSEDSLNRSKISFREWPALRLRCKECWFLGQNLGSVTADLTPKDNILRLENGLIEAGGGRLAVNGQWLQQADGDETSVNLRLSGSKIDRTSTFFDISMPIKDASFAIDADMRWRGLPWQPQINSLNGSVKSKLGKGALSNLGGGRAGQLLRLVSIDALIRKLQLDFSDTFSQDFAFDAIRGTANIKQGILYTKDLFIDGLAADIAMNGRIDLVRRQINMEAVITPEISATVGVATAFVINPVIGAAVFAATKALGPLWNKISLIRYQITGSLDQPKIHEVLRQLKENKAS